MSKIKGVLLCGGEGTRLRPLTYATNKHLVRVGTKPMIDYPLYKMLEAGIDNIHVVTGGENYQGVVKYLGSGSRWGIRITYSIQDASGGIAQALSLAEPFVDKSKCLVILGDNIFNANIKYVVETFANDQEKESAVLFRQSSKTPERFGVLQYNDQGIVQDIVEKPKVPPSNDILVGIYMYTPDVFDKIRSIKPSGRGELEITDVNREYVKRKTAHVFDLAGEWTDCGTFDTLLKAEKQVVGNG